MSSSELENQVARFGQNESRVDKWVNGGPTETYKTSDGADVPTIRNINNQVAYMPVQFDKKLLLKADTSYVNTALSNLSTNANKYYSTLAAANADISNIALNQSVTIGEQANAGLWYKATAGATSLTKSPYDPLNQFQGYVDTFLEGFLINEGDNWSTL